MGLPLNLRSEKPAMDTTASDFVLAGSLKELKAKGRLVAHGRHRPVLLVHEGGHVFALDNRCPHMGFPLDRGSVEDGILTCHWHHARFELASGCTFDLWADDVPTCPVEIRAGGEIWVQPVFGYADQVGHCRERLGDGLSHNLSLVIAKAVHGQLAAGQSPSEVIKQAALFGTRNRDGWDTGLTILTALGQLLPFLSEEEAHLALFHGVRRVAADCDSAAPSRERAPLASRPDLATLKRWLRRWVAVRHRDAAERTVLTAIAGRASPPALADPLFADQAALSESLLGDDPVVIIDALTAAARDGASPADLGRALAYAAALRIARFGTANEHSDWETAHHIFTYANAVHQALNRIGGGAADPGDPVEAVRGLLHGAMALYLARYLNVAPASLPGEGRDGLDDLPVAAEEIRGALLDTFDRQHQIDAAARLVARHLILDHSPEALIATLASALLRED